MGSSVSFYLETEVDPIEAALLFFESMGVEPKIKIERYGDKFRPIVFFFGPGFHLTYRLIKNDWPARQLAWITDELGFTPTLSLGLDLEKWLTPTDHVTLEDMRWTRTLLLRAAFNLVERMSWNAAFDDIEYGLVFLHLNQQLTLIQCENVDIWTPYRLTLIRMPYTQKHTSGYRLKGHWKW